MAPHHDTRFPNETESYRVAQDALLTAEMELRARTEEVAVMRRALPMGGALKEDYVLTEGTADLQVERNERQTAFSELFAPGKDTLVA
jgi:predicted dithiol-disulfide oxidoreductase (DUF899 family)